MASIFTYCFDGLWLTCGISEGFVVSVDFGRADAVCAPRDRDAALWERVKRQLSEYFALERREFDLPLSYAGTEFQRLVWDGLRAIPYGQTRTYGELARLIGHPRAARAVGQACHVNPISVIIPCHRVVGSDGGLTGFGGGLDAKAKLLELERRGKCKFTEVFDV